MTEKRESRREERETGFTEILRGLFTSSPAIRAIVFVDHEGEAVDYVSEVPTFDAKVLGAHVHVLFQEIVREAKRRAFDVPYFLHIAATRQEIAARRIDDEYLLVLLVEPETLTPMLLEALHETAQRLREEGRLGVPSWDAFSDPIEVELRPAVGWDYAPRAFRHRGRRIAVADVIGRWHERDVEETTCFRVRTKEGAELTLVYHLAQDLWTHRS